MINFDNLEEVKTVNSRTNYDLRYSAKTGKFTLSEEAYRKYDINNQGFHLLKDGDTPVLSVVENDIASVHKGRSDAEQKGKTFTANSLANMLGLDDEDARFTFEEVENNGNTYLLLEDMDAEETEDVSITSDENSNSDIGGAPAFEENPEGEAEAEANDWG